MLKLPNGSVWLNQGEIVPVFCHSCAQVYQPESCPLGHEKPYSYCPKCGAANEHKAEVVMVPIQAVD